MRWTAAFLSLLLLSGCGWQEAENLSVATAAAVETQDSEIALTLEIARPTADNPIPSSETLTAHGRTVEEAIETASSERSLYLSHADLLLIDEATAQNGLSPLLDYAVEHSDRLRLGTRICIVRGCTPSDILNSETTSGEPAGYALSRSLDRAIESGLAPDLPIYQLIERIADADMEAVLPAVTLREGAAVPDGCAVLRGGVPAGYLSQTETELLCLLAGSAEEASYPLATGETIRLSQPTCRIQASWDSRPIFELRLTAAADTDQRTAAARALERDLDALMTRLYTDLAADPLGLMREMRRTQFSRYESHAPSAPSGWDIRTTVHLTGGDHS